MAKDAGGKWYPLHSALIFGDLPSAKSLFEKGCSDAGMLVTSNSKGWRALHFATQSGHNESVEWLLGLEGCDAAARTTKGETALHLSALRGDERICQRLIDGGCPPEAVTREGKTALHLAAGKGHLAVTRFLVVGAGLSPSSPDGGGASAAALALAGNHKSVVRLLQKNCPGVPMGVPKRSNNNSRRSLDAAGLLPSSELAGGSDFQGRKGRRNLRAREGGISFGGDGGGRGKGGGGKRGGAKAAEEAGRRLLEASRVGDTLAMGRVLASGDVDVEWVGRGNGWTAVMEAAEHGSLEAVSFLLDKGADLEHTNNKGLTPLQLAVRSGHLGVTEELLIRGARPNVTTKAGLCLRCLANSMGHGYLADWLFAMGVADGVDGGCACSGGAKSAGGGGDEPASNANAAIARQHSGGSAHSNGGAPSSPPPPPAGSETGAPTAALTEWLASLGLSAYESRLVSEGFDTLDAMCAATEPDLEAMGFKKGHLRLLLARAPSASTLTTTANGGGGDRRVSFVDDRGARAGSPPVAVASAPRGGGGGGGGSGWVNPSEVMAQPVTRGVGDEDKEETDPRYCDAWVLQPSRALSAGENSGGDRARSSSSSAAEGFKELKPEEVEVHRVIGEGSFGVVRRARWRGMEVAVKELKTCIASAAAVAAASGAAPSVTFGGGDSNGATAGTELGGKVKQRDIDNLVEGQEEMRHEARMLAKVCNHNCVVQFVGVLLRPVPSVVTMFMENGSVEDMLVSSDKKATKDLVCRMAIEAAKGVIHLHREGVVHRDLASRNLLLDDGFHVRISDFGFSRVKRECASRGYTRSDMGPIKWTSPEAMRKRCYSEASDAFSFGVVLYEMFARSPPWEGHENLDVAFRVCSGERMTVPPRVDAPLADLMHKCWNESSRLRPDFASILTALTAFAGDQELARANGVEGGGAAALVEADPSPPPPPPPRDGKKSAAAVKIARAKAEAAELAKAAVAELRRRKLTTLRAVTELQRQGPGYTAAESEEVSAQQGRRRRDGGGAAVAGAGGRRHSLRREASGQRAAAAAAAGPLSGKAGEGAGGGEGAASAEPEASGSNGGASRLSRQGSGGTSSGVSRLSRQDSGGSNSGASRLSRQGSGGSRGGGGGRGTDGRGRGGLRSWNGDVGGGGGRFGTARGGGRFEAGRGGGGGRSGKGRSFPPRGGSTSTAGRWGERFGGRGDGGRGPSPGGAAPSGDFAGPPPPPRLGEGHQGRVGGRGGRFSVDR